MQMLNPKTTHSTNFQLFVESVTAILVSATYQHQSSEFYQAEYFQTFLSIDWLLVHVCLKHPFFLHVSKNIFDGI